MSSKSSYSSSSRRHTHDRKSARSRSPRRSKKEERHKHENKSSKKDIQRGIDKAKNLLKSSLSEAIDDVKSLESSRNVAVKQERQDISDIIDSVSRQEAIERIDNPGFKPCSFKSDADSGRSTSSKNSENVTSISSAATQHDRAMFGPLWANKKIVEKCTKKDVNSTKKRVVVDEQKEEKEEEEVKNVPISRFPLAHEKLSEDPEIRNQRWLELFRERRKMAIEGIL